MTTILTVQRASFDW